ALREQPNARCQRDEAAEIREGLARRKTPGYRLPDWREISLDETEGPQRDQGCRKYRLARTRDAHGSRCASVSHEVGVAPGALEWQAPGMRRDELVNGIRPPRAWSVRSYRRRRFQQRRGHFPQSLDPDRAGEQRVIPA